MRATRMVAKQPTSTGAVFCYDKSMNKVIYSGIFFDDAEVDRLRKAFPATLANTIELPHVTLRYVARTFWPTYPELYGQEVKVKVVAYASNGRNEGVRVELSADDAQLAKMCKDLAVPHITLAVADGGKPVNTVNLDFQAVDSARQIELVGKYGAYMSDGSVVCSS